MEFASASGITAGLAGFLLGLSLAAPPGPILAVMAHESINGRIRRSLSMAAGAMTGDAIWLGLAAIGTITVFRNHPRVIGVLGMFGALLLLWMAWTTWQSARQDFHAVKGKANYRLGILTALTSPYSFAWWFANGALLVSTWGWPGIVGMFTALVTFSVAISYVFRALGKRFEAAMRWVAIASAVLLFAFGVYFAWGAWSWLSGASLPG